MKLHCNRTWEDSEVAEQRLMNITSDLLRRDLANELVYVSVEGPFSSHHVTMVSKASNPDTNGQAESLAGRMPAKRSRRATCHGLKGGSMGSYAK